MPDFAALTPERHGSKSLAPLSSFAFAATSATVPITAAELSNVANTMPIAFVKEQASYKVVALLSPFEGTNLFVSPGGKWLGQYVPTLVRSFPFRLLRRTAASDEWVLCVDELSPQLVEGRNAGKALFEQDGSPSALVKEVTASLERFERGQLMLANALSALSDLAILCPWEINVKLEDRQQAVVGLYRVDESALTRLGDEAFLDLRKSQALPLAYTQLVSMGQLELLQRLVQFHVSQARAPSSFNLTGEDSLHFG